MTFSSRLTVATSQPVLTASIRRRASSLWLSWQLRYVKFWQRQPK
jgi:hypothetical protein